jgi:tripartite-type tricarboxylate transporter receptor subunit TctC
MTRQFRRLAAAIALGFVAMLSGPQGHAQAQTWPDRSVKWILPFGAGSATDIAARLLAERLSAKVGQAGGDREPAGRRRPRRHQRLHVGQ